LFTALPYKNSTYLVAEMLLRNNNQESQMQSAYNGTPIATLAMPKASI
jgi:hypothetical protein